MTRDEIGALFVAMLPELRKVARAELRRKDDEGVEDVLHDALVSILADIAEGINVTEVEIAAVVKRIASARFHTRRKKGRLFPDPSHWVLEGRHVSGGGSDQYGDVPGDPTAGIPDPKPGPEELTIRQEAEDAIAALGRRLGQDPSWRGEMYRLLYVEGMSIKEAAKRMGIGYAAARAKAVRLHKYLGAKKEWKRIRELGRE